MITPAATSAIKIPNGPVTTEENSHILFLTAEPHGFLLVQEETLTPQTFFQTKHVKGLTRPKSLLVF